MLPPHLLPAACVLTSTIQVGTGLPAGVLVQCLLPGQNILELAGGCGHHMGKPPVAGLLGSHSPCTAQSKGAALHSASCGCCGGRHQAVQRPDMGPSG